MKGKFEQQQNFSDGPKFPPHFIPSSQYDQEKKTPE